MAITSYDTLVAALGDWLERADLTARAADFITLAEAQMNRTLRVRQMETRVSNTVVINGEFVDLPADFLEEKSLVLSDGSTTWSLDPQPDEVLSASDPATGAPTSYAVTGTTVHLYPKPNKAYTLTVVYYAAIPALSATRQTNWLLAKAPDAYLYGALTHAAPFLEDDTGTAGTFASLFGGAVTALKAEQRSKVGHLTTDHPQIVTGRSFNILKG